MLGCCVFYAKGSVGKRNGGGGRQSVNLSLRFIEHEGFLYSLEMSSLRLAGEPTKLAYS